MIFLQSAACILVFIHYVIAAGFFSGPAFALLLAFLCLVFARRISDKKVIVYSVSIFQAAAVIGFSFIFSDIFLLLPFALFPAFFRERILTKIIISITVIFPFFRMESTGMLLYAAAFAAGITVSLSENRIIKISGGRQKEIEQLEKEILESGRKLDKVREAGISDRDLAVFLERDRIAQKLHDELGHTITGSIMQLDAAEILLKDNPEKAGKIISITKNVLRKGMENIRMSIKSLKPVSGDMGLITLKQQMNEFMNNNDIRTIFTADEKRCRIIPPEIWELVSLNLKEALTNFLKYGDGREFYFTIEIMN